MATPELAIIVAMDRRRVIGRDGALPWHLPGDLQYFKRVTMGNPIIMGRRTHESIGRPLPGRPNIVVSHNPAYAAAGCQTAVSLAGALALVASARVAFVIGGAAIYREALPLASRLHVTEVHAEVDGDVRFPHFDRQEWTEVAREDHPADARNAYPYSFVELRRIAR